MARNNNPTGGVVRDLRNRHQVRTDRVPPGDCPLPPYSLAPLLPCLPPPPHYFAAWFCNLTLEPCPVQVEMPTIAWSKMFEVLSTYDLAKTALANPNVNTVHVCEAVS